MESVDTEEMYPDAGMNHGCSRCFHFQLFIYFFEIHTNATFLIPSSRRKLAEETKILVRKWGRQVYVAGI